MKQCFIRMPQIFFLLWLFSASSHALDWNDLWSTPDQQGRDYMAKNQFVQAKENLLVMIGQLQQLIVQAIIKGLLNCIKI